jgi:hypothetical protein
VHKSLIGGGSLVGGNLVNRGNDGRGLRAEETKESMIRRLKTRLLIVSGSEHQLLKSNFLLHETQIFTSVGQTDKPRSLQPPNAPLLAEHITILKSSPTCLITQFPHQERQKKK